ncbi:pitrilysin family protein [Aphanizomenon flos-aquae NRERC-008]|uniref:Insulinase family protein n=3 Tax=Aphanizomenon flos-aquae TaxID=1176 RepID=A0ABR8IT55_APHFL|nr:MULTISPECIES: pitrilysin family protein [Aphanizomenon]MBD2390628.1 insulinase family protein [Aphanizomenon flos-aquae FACHB-1171]MBD2632040.1 insulinase family protein [Aphanizomenon sp. FACHB-1399]MBD2642849.1 insulinase family protein [Aphanizomenon sp. FACHB-1401]MBD2657440.1 insulinase family protein [Aphanizomenon flos-aquae FACHB-1265]MBD2674456.1 insulinase family protein [Aphanizomenon flos-aquae FACHB-1416]
MTSTLLKLPRLNTPTVHHIPNGLTIIVEQMPIDAVNLNLWVKTGSAMEADTINGMAHFLEHIVFKGTKKLISGEFERRIEERGALTNAATSQDYTHYYITTAPQDFAELAPLQIDVVCNPSIPHDAFERERLVVLEEIRRSQDNPRRRIYRHIMETAFDYLPYRRPVLGSESIISQIQPQQMRDFHTHWYQPQSITAVAVGNLPVEELVEIIATEFNKNYQQPPNKPTPIAPTPEPPFTEIVRQEIIDQTLQQARLVMVWRVPGLIKLDQTYALDIIAGILGHGRTSRLVQDLREQQELVSSISVSNMSNLLQGVFSISAKCNLENIATVEKAIAQHLHILYTEIVKESEISRIQQRIANQFIFGNETPSDRAGLYGYYQSLIGDLKPAFNYPQHIQSITATDLIQAVKNYLSPDAYGIVIVKPA